MIQVMHALHRSQSRTKDNTTTSYTKHDMLSTYQNVFMSTTAFNSNNCPRYPNAKDQYPSFGQ